MDGVEAFLQHAHLDPPIRESAPWRDPEGLPESHILRRVRSLCGRSVGNGAFWVVGHSDQDRARRLVASGFPTVADGAFVFGQDWLGRFYAVSLSDVDCRVVRLDIAFGSEVMDSEIPLDVFLGESLTDLVGAVDWDVLTLWARGRSGGLLSRGRHGDQLPLTSDRCVGFKVPLFLGGDFSAANLAPTDLEVYWELTGQLLSGVGDASPGTRIRAVDVDGYDA